MPASGAYVADLAPPDKRGLYMGTYGMVWALAFVCGPSLGLVLFSVNHVLLWLTCGVLGVVAAGIIAAGPNEQPTPAGRPVSRISENIAGPLTASE